MKPVLRSWLRILLALALALPCEARRPAGEAAPPAAELGDPFIRNYPPKEYGADSQNWSAAQDARGVIYVANNQGVLEYDGVRWRLIRTPNKTVVRSVAADAHGRIYVGAVGEIGYLAPDEHGQARFVSLTGLVEAADRNFSDVWVTSATPRGILFQSRECLFLYDGGRIRSWRASTTFHVAFKAQDRIFVRQRNVGLMELKEEGLALLPGGERFAKESVFTMLSLEGSGILIGSRNLGLWRYDGAAIKPFPSEADAFLKANALYNGTRLSDGTLALATITGGVAFMGADGRMRGVLDRASGLQGDNVKFLFPDRRSSLWLALDNGISKVEWPSPLTLLDERFGLKGTVWAMLRHQGSLYVATGQGAFKLEAGPSSGSSNLRPVFKPLEGVKTQSLSFLSFGEDLLLANSQGVFDFRGSKAELIRPSSNVAISLRRSKRDPSRVFVGLQGGLASLRRAEDPHGGWADEGLIPGVSEDIYSLVESPAGELWMGTGSQGVLRATFPAGWKGGTEGGAPRIDHFGAEQGLPSTIQTYVLLVGGVPTFTTHEGIFRFDEASGRFSPDARFAHLFPEGPRWVKGMVVDPAGRIWLDSIDEARGIHETGEAVAQGDGSFRWDSAPYKRFSESAIEAIYPEQGGPIWFGGPGGIYRYDPALARGRGETFSALISRVTSRSGPVVSGGEGPVLRYGENALRFEFAAPSFDQESANQFQVLLEGYDKAWSPWTSEAQKEYTNLREGRYRFRVRARNVYGAMGEEALYPFRILPPWYRRWWAYLLYLGLLSWGIALAFRARTRLLRERNINLHARIAEATMELYEREQQLERMNRDLQRLNEQKNQYLGIVAHDLRNPLHGILLTAEMIEASSDLEEARQMARKVSAVGGDMSSLISRFLDIAAIDAGTIKPELEAFSLTVLAEETLEAFKDRARLKGIALRGELPEAPVEVIGDPKFMQSALDNLVSNALKFSQSGTTVELRLQAEDGKAILSVIDQGPGLSAEDKAKLFGRFTKLSARPTGGEGSVGLGLSIIKHMVDAMGGRIWVESEPGQGATFRVELPLAPRS